MDLLFHGRMDWGLGNPNKTAALIATLMLAVWLLAYVRKWGFWLALTLFFGLGVCLVQTLSRGGIVGIIVGGLFALGWIARPYPFPRMLGLVLACLGLIVFACLVNEQSRVVKVLSGDDLSVENRLLIWKQVPSMIRDAPDGWGIGKSGDAYMQWYQPVTRGEGYRTLVNSHLTWLVEFNWWGKIAYITAWVAAFVLLWPDSKHRWVSVPLAVWVALAVCAAFSSVAESPWVWIIPVLGFLGVLFIRIREKAWPSTVPWISGACASLGLIVSVFLWQAEAPSSPIHCPHEGLVTLGARTPALWVVAPDLNVLGEHYGHEARRGFQTESIYQQAGLGIVTAAKDAPANETLIFSGKVPQSPVVSDEIVLVSPRPPDSPKVMQWLATMPKVTVIVGEYSSNKDFWNEQSKSHPNIKLQVVEGMEDYISDWAHQIALVVEDSNKIAMPVTNR